MYCPLKSSDFSSYEQRYPDNNCDESSCAFWCIDYGLCAIPAIAISLISGFPFKKNSVFPQNKQQKSKSPLFDQINS